MHLRVWCRATILDLKPLSPKLNQQDQPFPEMAHTKFMITCMLHFRESYPESCPRIIPANHTTNHTHDFEAIPRIIPRIMPANHTSETYLESYPLMQHALLGTEFSERAGPGTEGTFLLLRSFRAVSVHHIATTLQEDICRRRSAVGFDQSELGSLLQEIHAAGLTRDAKVYECGTR